MYPFIVRGGGEFRADSFAPSGKEGEDELAIELASDQTRLDWMLDWMRLD